MSQEQALGIALSSCKYPVYLFCKENNIECSHDFNRAKGISWTEIYLRSKIVMQVDGTSTVDEFIKLCKMIYNYWGEDEDTEYDDGSNIWIAAPDKQIFYRFINRYHEIFLKENK